MSGLIWAPFDGHRLLFLALCFARFGGPKHPRSQALSDTFSLCVVRCVLCGMWCCECPAVARCVTSFAADGLM